MAHHADLAVLTVLGIGLLHVVALFTKHLFFAHLDGLEVRVVKLRRNLLIEFLFTYFILLRLLGVAS